MADRLIVSFDGDLESARPERHMCEFPRVPTQQISGTISRLFATTIGPIGPMFTTLVHDERPTIPNAAMSRADRTPILKGQPPCQAYLRRYHQNLLLIACGCTTVSVSSSIRCGRKRYSSLGSEDKGVSNCLGSYACRASTCRQAADGPETRLKAQKCGRSRHPAFRYE